LWHRTCDAPFGPRAKGVDRDELRAERLPQRQRCGIERATRVDTGADEHEARAGQFIEQPTPTVRSSQARLRHQATFAAAPALARQPEVAARAVARLGDEISLTHERADLRQAHDEAGERIAQHGA
jgi:hypothetical protein